RELDYVWKRPRHALRESKSPRVLRRLRAIRKKVRNLPAGCARLFEDETDLHLFPPLRAGWFLRGEPAEVPISGGKAKRSGVSTWRPATASSSLGRGRVPSISRPSFG